MKNSSNRLVFLLGLSWVCFAAVAGIAQGPIQSVDTLTVVDANGKKVGNVLALDNHGWKVALRAKKTLLVLNVLPQGLVGTDDYLFFNTYDCSGTPLFYAAFPQQDLYGGLPQDATRSAVLGTKVYVFSGDQQLTTPNSTLSLSGAGPSFCTSGGFQITDYYRPASVLVDLGPQFSAPFKVVGAATQ